MVIAFKGSLITFLQDKKDALSRELLTDIKMEMDDDDEDDFFNKSLTDRLGSIKSDPDIKPTKEKKPRKPRQPKDPNSKISPKKVSSVFTNTFPKAQINVSIITAITTTRDIFVVAKT